MDWQAILIVFVIVFVVVVFIVVAIIAAVVHFNRAGSILQNWAARNGFRILAGKRCLVWQGPFFFGTSESQEVYRVTIQDHSGYIRSGYVRCGGYFLGTFSDQAEVVWDPEAPQQPGFPVVFPGPPARPRENGGDVRQRC